MDIFDDCIREIRKWFRLKENEGKARQYDKRIPAEGSNISASASGGGAGSTIIFKEDTRLELGNPSAGSCAAALATGDASLVVNGRITLVGPDVGETDDRTLPFAQIALACCDGDIERTCSTMDRVLHASAQTDGYMLRSVPDMIWARVSNKAADSGFSIRGLGSRLIGSLCDQCPGIGKSEMFFVTSSREDVSQLKEIVSPAQSKMRKLQSFGRNEDGVYECDTSLDCDVCPEKTVCDTIRDVITIRKGDRIITLGGGKDDKAPG
jgi:CO dehydrogenase/acetyl-CoA synthase beta subunit